MGFRVLEFKVSMNRFFGCLHGRPNNLSMGGGCVLSHIASRSPEFSVKRCYLQGQGDSESRLRIGISRVTSLTSLLIGVISILIESRSLSK